MPQHILLRSASRRNNTLQHRGSAGAPGEPTPPPPGPQSLLLASLPGGHHADGSATAAAAAAAVAAAAGAEAGTAAPYDAAAGKMQWRRGRCGVHKHWVGAAKAALWAPWQGGRLAAIASMRGDAPLAPLLVLAPLPLALPEPPPFHMFCTLFFPFSRPLLI